MANYLFLLGMYYPRSSANGVCCKNIVDELIKQGHQVTCIVNNDITSQAEEVIDGANIYRIKPKMYYRITEFFHYHPKFLLKRPLDKVASIINRIYLFFKASTWPLVSPSYTNRFYSKAKELCGHTKYDVIVAVYTPFDTLYAGYMLKKDFPYLKFVPYYLDAFAGGWGPNNWSKEKINERTRSYETKINSLADLVISMKSSTEYHKANPLNNSNLYKRIFLDVPTLVLTHNFYDSTDSNGSSSTSIKNISLVALYSGSIHYPDRNPIPLLEHFLELSKKHNIELWFMGANNCQNIFDRYAKLSNNKIKTIGQFSHDEAVEKMRLADFYVNIGSTNPNTICCKIFEYMQFRKPIISTYQIENEPSFPYLKQYKNFFLLNESQGADFKSINNALCDFIYNQNKQVANNLADVFYDNTPQAFIDALNKL